MLLHARYHELCRVSWTMQGIKNYARYHVLCKVSRTIQGIINYAGYQELCKGSWTMQVIMILLVTKYHELSTVSWVCCDVIFNSSISFRFKALKSTKTFINSFCKTLLNKIIQQKIWLLIWKSVSKTDLLKSSLKKISSVVHLYDFLHFQQMIFKKFP